MSHSSPNARSRKNSSIEPNNSSCSEGWGGTWSSLRDAFGGVVIAAECVALWMALGTASAEAAQVIVAASFGGAMFLPFTYFARKARLARRDLKKLRQARRSGEILQSG